MTEFDIWIFEFDIVNNILYIYNIIIIIIIMKYNNITNNVINNN